MKIYVSQIYIQSGVSYPFTHRFQQFLSKAITERIAQSESFVRQYGCDFTLIFRMSAKSDIQEVEIKGPTVFRRDRNVEYTIFLPYHGNNSDSNALSEAIAKLLSAIVNVVGSLGFDTAAIVNDSAELTKQIVGDPSMTK